MAAPLNTLVYKRTHKGDPDESAIFGIHDCMGRVRSLPFDAVIGVGGKSPWPNSKDIALKINWVGIGPHKSEASSIVWSGARRPDWAKVFRAPLVAFDHFVFFPDGTGPMLEDRARLLSRHMFKDSKHFVMSRSLRSEGMKEEIQEILEWAMTLSAGSASSNLSRTSGNAPQCLKPVSGKKSSTGRKC
jgi:hypothetical protein